MKISWKTVLPLIVWLVVVLIPTPAGLQPNAWAFFAVFAAVITGMIFDSMAPGALGLIGVAFAVAMRYVNADVTQSINWGLSGFSDTTVWLIFGAFTFAIGYSKSGLGRRIALFFVKLLGGRTLGLGYAIELADLVLAPGTPSNTARSAGTIFPVIRNIPALYGSEANSPTARKIGSYIMWTAFAATGVTSSMFITALAPNAAALTLVKTATKLDINWMQWFLGFLPVAIVLLVLVPLLVYVIYPPEIKTSKEIPEWASSELAKMGPLSRNEIKMIVLVLFAIFLWVTGSNSLISLPYLGTNYINATSVVLVAIALMLVTQVVDFQDIISNKAAWEVFLYFATLLTLAAGLNTVGFIKWFADLVSAPLKGLDPILILAVLVALFFWIHYFFTSLTAHTTAVLPVVLAVGVKLLPPNLLMPFSLLCVYSLGIMGVISPYATGPAPIYYGSGFVSRSDFWKLGLIFGLIFFFALLLIGIPYLTAVKL